MKTICISAQDDGSFSVYEEKPEGMEAAAPMPGADPAAEMPMGDMGAEAAPAQAASIDEALNMARQLLQSDGRSAEEQMMAGYNKAKPQGMNKPSPEQVFGG